MNEIAAHSGPRSDALSQNDRSEVVGYILGSDGRQHAFAWTRERGAL
jgi:hypothetical protein